jgi:hypothetical protein
VTVLKQTGCLGGVPLEIPPSKDKTISHGLDAVGGSVAFSVGFQVVLKPEKYNLKCYDSPGRVQPVAYGFPTMVTNFRGWQAGQIVFGEQVS